MARKHITDKQVVEAYLNKQDDEFPYEFLARTTGEYWKVCYRAMERACSRGLIDYGVCLRAGWVTAKGKELLCQNAADVPTS